MSDLCCNDYACVRPHVAVASPSYCRPAGLTTATTLVLLASDFLSIVEISGFPLLQ